MASLAWAEDETIKIKEVVVSAAKIEELVEETTSDVIVITEREIKEMNVEFVPDVLKMVTDLNLIQNGGAGKLAEVFLRGGSAKHTMVMIDGVRVKSTTTGSFDFSGISVDDIERIEIVKGPQSTIYGSEAMAGVINIITKRGKGKPKITTSIEAGSYGTFKPSVSVSGGDKGYDYRLTGSYFYTDGISVARDGTEKDGYRNASISGRFGFRPMERLELELSGRYYYDRSELDAFKKDDPNYVQHGHHYIVSAKGKVYLSNTWEQILTLSRTWDSWRYRDPDTSWNNADITTAMNTIDWQHNIYPTDNYTLTVGAEYRKEDGENEGVFDESVDNRAIYINNKLKLLNEDLIINAGLRYDDHETFGDETTYRIGAIYNIKSADLKVKGSYGTGFRAPTLNELFYNDPWGSHGNPDLKPERSNSWEIGVEKEIIKDRASISLTYFNQEYKDLIQWVESPPDSWIYIPQNVARAEIIGFEISGYVRLTDNIRLTTGYTHLDTEDKDTGNELPRRPTDKVNISLECSKDNATVTLGYTFAGKSYDDANNLNELSSYSLVNISGDYKIAKGVNIFGRIENLLDEDYEVASGYNSPGFSAYAGIRLEM
ncbi:MAG: TonB-dependent receptor [Thermodesulfovibrionia bacterium]